MRRFFRDLLNVPNTMSIFRILGAPMLAWFWMGLDWWAAGLALGTAIGLSDMFDGVIARKLNQITELGALLDQLGDLIFESTTLIIAVTLGEFWVGWLIIYLVREFTVMVVRSYVQGNGGSLPSTTLGKAKSSCLQWAFFFFFLGVIIVQPGVVPDSWSMVGIPPGRMLIWFGVAAMISGITSGLLAAWIYVKSFVSFYIEHNQLDRSGGDAG